MRNQQGMIVTYVLVFGGIFLMLLSGLLGFVLLQHKQSLQRIFWTESLEIAEAGVNYARWRLAHAPSDFNFSGLYDYKDPEGAIIGRYNLEITPPTGCDASIKIKSTGSTLRFPDIQRKIQVIYAKPALAQYGFLSNSNVWFFEEESLKGPIHSNGGIRMDGSQNSLSTSAKTTYTCGQEHGCSPSQEKPGIWGSGQGQNQGLWEFPVSAIDFNSITQDLAVLKADAQSSGIYISQPVALGFHVNFKIDGTMDVFRVKKLKQKVWGWDGEDWRFETNDIDQEDFYANYSLPNPCAPIFFDNDVWVDGIVKGRATLVAASLPEMENKMRKIIIKSNIDYADDGSVLGLIAQKDVLIPLYSPDNLSIKASMLAQKGHVMRYYYPPWSSEPYNTYVVRDYIETFGSIISNDIWTFSWGDEGDTVSGYEETEMMYDPDLTYRPPPYFPTSGEYEFVSWEEL